MLQLNLLKVAEDLDIAIRCFDEATVMLEGIKDETITEEHREKLKKLSKQCMGLESLRNETDLMLLERTIHFYNAKEATEKISKVSKELKDARSLINI